MEAGAHRNVIVLPQSLALGDFALLQQHSLARLVALGLRCGTQRNATDIAGRRCCFQPAYPCHLLQEVWKFSGSIIRLDIVAEVPQDGTCPCVEGLREGLSVPHSAIRCHWASSSPFNQTGHAHMFD